MKLRLLFLCITFTAFTAYAGALPAQVLATLTSQSTLQREFDNLVQSKDLDAASRYLLLSAGGETPLTDFLDILAGKPGDPTREETIKFLSGMKNFSRAVTQAAFEKFFKDPEPAASCVKISIEKATQQVNKSQEVIEAEKDAVLANIKALSKATNLEIRQLTLPPPPRGGLGGTSNSTLALTLFFTQAELGGKKVWRVSYAYGLLVDL